MTILWCGGEYSDFMINTTFNKEPFSSSYYRSSYCRTTVQCSDPYLKLIGSQFTPQSSLWFSFRMFFSSIPGDWSDQNYGKLGVGLGKYGTNAWIGIGSTLTIGGLALYKYDHTTVTKLAEAPAGTLSPGVVHKVDIQITNYGNNGTVNIYLNTVLVLSYTGDIAVLSQTTLDQVYIMTLRNDAYSGNTKPYISEIIVADEDTRGMSLKTLVPISEGDTNNWTGAYTDIDEVVANDLDKIYTNTSLNTVQFNLDNMPVGDWDIKALKINAVAANSSDKGLQIGIKTNGTEYYSSTKTLQFGYTLQDHLLLTNPNTGVKFTKNDIDNLQLSFKCI